MDVGGFAATAIVVQAVLAYAIVRLFVSGPIFVPREKERGE